MNSRTISVLTGVLLVTTALRAQELAATNAAKEVDNWYKEGERTYRSGDHAAAVVLFSKGVTSFRELGSLSVRLPSLAATAFLKGVYGFRDEDAARARRIATVATVFIVVTTAVAVLAIFVLAL